MKTIAQSLINKAGFDKTRSGKVVGKNELTNTYSIKVDGHIYNNVRTVNDSTYNVGDTVRINIPVNQMSQAYISASIYSDASIGKKIGHAESLIEAADQEITNIIEIMGKIYQLSIRSDYSANSVTHYGVMMQNGEDVTSSEYTVNFHWYLQKTTGKTAIGTGASVTLDTEDFLYGQAVLLEWEVDNVVKLRTQVILFDNTKVEEVAEKAYDAYDIATNEAQYFWFNEDGTDNGAHISYYPQVDFESNPRGHNLLANADGVAVRKGVATLSAFTENGMYINGMLNNSLQLLAHYGSDGIWFNEGISYKIGNNNAYIKYEYDDGWKIKISADQITLGNQQVATTDMIASDIPYLTEISTGGLFVHRNDSEYNGANPTSSTAYGVQLASTVDIIRAGKSLATFDENQITFRTKEGYTTATVGTSGFTLYRGASSSSNYAIASFTGNGMTLKNASGVNTLVSNSSGLTIYNGGASTNVALASFSASGITLKNSSDYKLFTAGANSMIMYDGTSYERALASFGSGGMTLRNTSGYRTLVTSASAMTIYSGNSSDTPIASFSGSGMTLKNSSGYTLCTVSGLGMSVYNSSGTQLANFGATATIGATSGYHLAADPSNGFMVKDSSSRTLFRMFGYSGGARMSFTNLKMFAGGASEDTPTIDITSSGMYVLGVINSTGNINAGGSLTLGGHSTAVGSVLTASQSSNRASSTDLANLSSAYIDLPAGSWALTLRCGGDLNSADKRLQFEIYNSTDSTEYTSTRTTLHTSNTGAVSGQCTLLISISAQKRFYCRCYQNSGSTVSLAAYFRAVRIA